MASRLELHEILCGILGTRNVYFQPPSSVRMQYPAIVYKRKDADGRFANNKIYRTLMCYEVTLIEKSPDTTRIDALLELQYCRYDRHYDADNLSHDVFTLYH